MKKVIIVLGHESDLPNMQGAVKQLRAFGVPFDMRIASAHRSPALAKSIAEGAEADGVGVIIAAAGKAAHLAGVIAAHTILPVIGVPVKASLEGLDALLSTVQMPRGIPVASMAIDGSDNAGLFAVQILALSDATLAGKYRAFKADMARQYEAKDQEVMAEYRSI